MNYYYSVALKKFVMPELFYLASTLLVPDSCLRRNDMYPIKVI